MKKIVLNKKIKLALIAICVILIGIISFLLFKHINSPETKEESISLYNYTSNSVINYEVLLKPNILYEKESLGEDEIIFKDFIENIKATFNYQFNGEREANITGDNEIVAVVEGYNSDGEESKTIWKKDFIISSKESFSSKDKTISISKDISFELGQYSAFVEEVIKQTNVRTQNKLTIYMNVKLKADTDKGIVEQNITPSIVIPLGASYFNIQESETGEKPGAIEETKTIEIPIDKQKTTFYGILIGIVGIALLVLLLFTQSVKEEDLVIKNLNKIFKNHGNRLVALNGNKKFSYENHSKVRTIEDLVRIADEVEKPIMYEYSSNFRDIDVFYVYNDNWMYMFDLYEYIMELIKEKNDEKSKKSVKNNKDKTEETKS